MLRTKLLKQYLKIVEGEIAGLEDQLNYAHLDDGFIARSKAMLGKRQATRDEIMLALSQVGE